MHLRSMAFRGLAAGGLFVLALGAMEGPANAAAAPITLRCAMHEVGTNDAIVEYFTVDSDRKIISSSGDTYRIGADPRGGTGRVITNWSDTEITLVNEEWIRDGWPRFRIVTVLDRLTGAVHSERNNVPYTGACKVADVTKRLF